MKRLLRRASAAAPPEPPRADLERARVLIEESREIVVVLDESQRADTVVVRGEIHVIDRTCVRRGTFE